MTATVSPLPSPRRPTRSGEPWTDDDYETLVRLCAEGATLASVAEELGRGERAVLGRARRMLPLDERGLPDDRALARLRHHLREDPGYDWGTRLTESPPPRPVEHTHVTVRRDGIPGLTDQDLLDVAELLVTGATTRVPAQREVLDEVLDRHLEDRLADRLGRRLVEAALSAVGLRSRREQAFHDEWYGRHAVGHDDDPPSYGAAPPPDEPPW